MALPQTKRLYQDETDYDKATPYRQAWNIIEDADPKLPKLDVSAKTPRFRRALRAYFDAGARPVPKDLDERQRRKIHPRKNKLTPIDTEAMRRRYEKEAKTDR